MDADDSSTRGDDAQRLLGDLNDAQRAAVTAPPGAHLVVAGAGTGKTRTLIYRVAHLVASGMRPESIVLLTFTRRAAQEMLRRAAGVLDERCQRVAGGTFHGFANLVLRRFADAIGYGEGFTILDRADAADLVGVLRAEGGYTKKGRRFPRKDTLLDLFSRQVNTGRPLEQLVAESAPQFVDELDAIDDLAKRYTARKQAQNVMDYDDLLVQLRNLLVRHAPARAALARRYRAVLVDEYQDTNRLQAHITALLAAAHGHLTVVGDEAQSIYGFRGASFRNIIDFPTVFEGCTTTLLEQNYRSAAPILDLANAILAQARDRFDKRLFTRRPAKRKPVFVRTDDEHGQARFVAEQILSLREQGIALDDIAVLARAAWHTNALELELQNRNIPFHKYGGIRFVEAAHVKDVCALLKLSLNPRDAAAWFRVLQLHDGIGPATAQRIGRAVVDAGGGLGPLTTPNVQRARYGDALATLGVTLSRLARPALTLGERIDAAIAYYKKRLPKKYDDVERRMRDLKSLSVIAERYDDLERFLSDLAIDPPDFNRPQLQDHDPDDEALTVSTVHSAKGLEWHTVFVLNLNDGHFPSWASRGDADAFEEERRLFYVAVTRAKDRLYLLRPETLAQRGSYRERVAEISPLLTEIDLAALTDEVIYTPPPEDDGWPQADSGTDGVGDDALLKRIQAYFGDDG